MLKKVKKVQAEVENIEGEMSFFDHLDVLRKHIIKSLIAVVIVAIIVYTFEDFVFKNVVFGPKNEGFLTFKFFCALGEKTCISPSEFNIITQDIGEQFFTSLKVSFWLGLIVAFPYVFYQFWSFIKPGLYDQERKATRGVVLICSFLFHNAAFTGTIFG